MNEISSIQSRRPDHFARWERVRERLRVSYGEAIFKSWLQPLKLADVKNGQAMITVPTRFMREWIIAHYADNILRFWCQEDQTVHSVDIFVKAEPVMVNNGASTQQQTQHQPAGLEAAMLGLGTARSALHVR